MVEQATFAVRGMVCRDCERSIRCALARVPGIKEACPHFEKRVVDIWFDSAIAARQDFENALDAAGYPVVDPARARVEKLAPLAIAVVLFLIVRVLPFASAPMSEPGMSPMQLFAIGLATSVHCIAMCGGILHASIANGFDRQARLRGGRSVTGAFSRSLVYNAGRLMSGSVIGFVLGAMGGVIAYTPQFKITVLLLASGMVVCMGLKVMGVLPNYDLGAFV